MSGSRACRSFPPDEGTAATLDAVVSRYNIDLRLPVCSRRRRLSVHFAKFADSRNPDHSQVGVSLFG